MQRTRAIERGEEGRRRSTLRESRRSAEIIASRGTTYDAAAMLDFPEKICRRRTTLSDDHVAVRRGGGS